jgi:hypothetical protein
MSERSENKICGHCGRAIDGRRMSEADWKNLKYCSARCRRSSGARIHRELEDLIVAMLGCREESSSICPSDIARLRFPDGWREKMEDVRRAARRLAHVGVVVITQKGKPVNPVDFRGPIRIVRGPMFDPQAS